MWDAALRRHELYRRRLRTVRFGLILIALAVGSNSGPRMPVPGQRAAAGSHESAAAGSHESAAAAAPSDVPVLEVYARLDQAPGNITVTPSGRVLVSLHQF